MQPWATFDGQMTEIEAILKAKNCSSGQIYRLKFRLVNLNLLRVQVSLEDATFAIDLKAADIPSHDADGSLLWVKLLIETSCKNKTLELLQVGAEALRLNSPFSVNRSVSEELCEQPQAVVLRMAYILGKTQYNITIQLPKILDSIWTIPSPLSPRSSELIQSFLIRHSQNSKAYKPDSAYDMIQSEILRLTNLLG